jgi:hypothetical protein
MAVLVERNENHSLETEQRDNTLTFESSQEVLGQRVQWTVANLAYGSDDHSHSRDQHGEIRPAFCAGMPIFTLFLERIGIQEWIVPK